MHNRIPFKMKRYLTEPDESSNENKEKFANITMKELKLHVRGMEQLSEINIPQIQTKLVEHHKMPANFIPLHSKIQYKRNALKKLPELNNISQSNGQQPGRTIQGPQLFKKNPLFVVNTLFHILKQDSGENHTNNNQNIRESFHNKATLDRSIEQSNQFSNQGAKSIKMYRPPRLIDNQLNRLMHQKSNFCRRKICSEQKSRSKVPQPQMELLTFYKPKLKETKKGEVEQSNQFLG